MTNVAQGKLVVIGFGQFGAKVTEWVSRRRPDGLNVTLVSVASTVSPRRKLGEKQFLQQIAEREEQVRSWKVSPPSFMLVGAPDDAASGGALVSALRWLQQEVPEGRRALWLALPPESPPNKQGRVFTYATLLELEKLREEPGWDRCWLYEAGTQRERDSLPSLFGDALLADAQMQVQRNMQAGAYMGFGFAVVRDSAAVLAERLAPRVLKETLSDLQVGGHDEVYLNQLKKSIAPFNEPEPTAVRSARWQDSARGTGFLADISQKNGDQLRTAMLGYYGDILDFYAGGLPDTPRIALSADQYWEGTCDSVLVRLEALRAIQQSTATLVSDRAWLAAVKQVLSEIKAQHDSLLGKNHDREFSQAKKAFEGLLEEVPLGDRQKPHVRDALGQAVLRLDCALFAQYMSKKRLSAIQKLHEWFSAVVSQQPPPPREGLKESDVPELKRQTEDWLGRVPAVIEEQHILPVFPGATREDELAAAVPLDQIRKHIYAYRRWPDLKKSVVDAVQTALQKTADGRLEPRAFLPRLRQLVQPRVSLTDRRLALTWRGSGIWTGPQGRELVDLLHAKPVPFQPVAWHLWESVLLVETAPFELGSLAWLGTFRDTYGTSTALPDLHVLEFPKTETGQVAAMLVTVGRERLEAAATTFAKGVLLGLIHHRSRGLVVRCLTQDSASVMFREASGLAEVVRALAEEGELRDQVDASCHHWLDHMTDRQRAAYAALVKWTEQKLALPTAESGPEAAAVKVALQRELAALGRLPVVDDLPTAEMVRTLQDDFSLGTDTWRYIKW